MDNEIKGIKIIEVENMEKYMKEEKYFLQVFSYMKVVQFLSMKHTYTNLIDKGVSGFIIKNSVNIKNFNIKLDILKRLCIENEGCPV